ncbi:MAG: hypothetical protein LBQ35_00215 [Spirochaetaceae bacterium]|jgi:xylulokinase|nr:hypothetical protein [Spirochaetaceae bacterium]
MLLVIDIGTSSFKAALLAYDGAWINAASTPLSFRSGGGRHEADPADWLAALALTLDGLGPLDAVEAVVISGNGPTVIPVTGEPSYRDGRLTVPADKARLWLDRRAEEESGIVSGIMGAYVDPSFFLPKILALRLREPELYERTRYFFAAPEFLAYALTGEARSVFPSEGFVRWYWDDRALEQTALDKAKFPPFVSPGDEIGLLRPETASRFGMNRRVRVIAGGPDFFVSILGAAAVEPGLCCDRSGSSEGINVCTRNRIVDPRLMSYGHPAAGYWNLSGIISTTGMAVSWALELLGLQPGDHGAFYDLAARSEAGAGGLCFLPYLAGERAPLWDPRARGVFMGLSLSTGREEAARSVAEGICYAISDVIAVMEELGAPVQELRATGGPSESAVLNQLKADITGRPVLVPAHREAELSGLGVIGAAALGKYGSFAEAASQVVHFAGRCDPDPAKAQVYGEGFARYRELYRALKPLFGSA